MLKTQIRSIPLWTGVGLCAASLILYVSTLAPTLTWGWNDTGVDGGELLAAANTLGIPHPPGYPTYILLLKAFATLVPIGDFAYRGNLLSAILASLSVALVYWAAWRICRSIKPDAPHLFITAAAVLAATVFATSPLMWSQAVMTEVYALNTLLASALLTIATNLSTRMRSGSNAVLFALYGFLLGIGLGNHLTLLAIGAPMLLWIGLSLGWRPLLSPWLIVSFIIGISIYIYLPIRADQGPPINWGNADTMRGVGWMLTARPYQEYVFGISAGTVVHRLIDWTELVFSQFNPLGLFLGFISITVLRRQASMFLATSLVSIVLISIYSITYNTFDFEVLMVPAFLLFSIWVAVGFFWILANWLPRWLGIVATSESDSWKMAYQVPLLILLIFLLLPSISVVLNYESQNLKNNRIAFDHASGIFEVLPDGSVVVSNSERNVFSLWYMRYVDRPERDIAVIAAPLLQFDWYRRDTNRLFPERIPLIDNSDIVEVIRQVVEHKNGGTRVFLTFWNAAIANATELTSVGGGLYEANPKDKD